jgi:demethylmenaquinone methyltransferase / 2-methoxy-6-polyprenyl-1,4-benzoquinol methylase
MNEKQQTIVGMFDKIAPTYDIANRILSFGTDISWRKEGIKKALTLGGVQNPKILDVATGTGDMLVFWKKAVALDAQYVGVDPSVGMLEVAKQKVSFAEFHEGYAQKLPFEDAKFDFLSISYGFRNVTEKEEAVQEFARVLKQNGRLLILEFAKNESKNPFRIAAQWYVKKVLPLLGGLISGNLSAYRYLPNSIEGFLTRSEICTMLERNGFEVEVAKDFSFGVSSLIIAKKK